MFKFIHAADFHLDSPFAALPAGAAAARRRESRLTVERLADYVEAHGIDAVLLCGDLFDSASPYRETGETLAAALGRMPARVFIAPGNHDWMDPASPWEKVRWPENVTIFRKNHMTAVRVPAWNAVFHGAAFTEPEQTASFLKDFSVPQDGRLHIGLLHGEIEPSEARYNPLSRQEIADSGLHYLALGHIHKRTEPLKFGRTVCAWPGCIEGRGFDELGEKGFYEGTMADDGTVSLTFVPFAQRRYWQLEVDVTGKDPKAAVEAALPDHAERDLCRILLTGETEEGGVDTAMLQEALTGWCYSLDLRDHTRLAEDLWQRAGEDSLRGLFLRELLIRRKAAQSDKERETIDRAARFGLAALDHRDLD